MVERSMVGLDETMAQAEEAVYTLDQAVLPVTQVSMVTQSLASDTVPHGHITPGDDLPPTERPLGPGLGAWWVCSSAQPSWVPGFGPLLVIGQLAALLLAGIEGPLAGTTAGALLI